MQKTDVQALITDFFQPGNLLSGLEFQNKIDAVIKEGYNPFSYESPFYNDICTPFTNENGNDVLLYERKKDYFKNNLNICKNDCIFVGYDASLNTYTCSCPIGGANNDEKELITNKLPDDFFKQETNSNIRIFKCVSQVFSSKGQKKNFGSYVLLVCLASFIGVVVYYYLKDVKNLDGLNDLVYNVNDNNIANPPRNTQDKSSENRIQNQAVESQKKLNFFQIFT